MITYLLVVAAVLLILWKLTSKPSRYPPGPFRWPLIGNIMEMKSFGALPHKGTAEYARRYGNVVGLYLGRFPIVVISGLSEIKEACGKEELSGRPTSDIAKKMSRGKRHGLITTTGEEWKEQRRFSLRHLRDLGFGKRSLEGIVHEEISDIFTAVERMAGPKWDQPVMIHDILGTAGVNVLWHVLAGQRYQHSDPRLIKLIDSVKKFLSVLQATGSMAEHFPLLFKYFPNLTEYPVVKPIREELENFIMEDVTKHQETLDPENPRDFLDAYLIEMNNQKGSETSFTEYQLVSICLDLFLAGSDTTLNSLTYALLYMALHTDVQTKVQEELDKVTGQNRLPSLEDRQHLIYTDATIQEILRCSSVAPLAVPHAPLNNDVEFRGYTIPKGARVMMNLAHLHMDRGHWGDPENFRPERFIDKDGKLRKDEGLIPFGSGKRSCLGEALARNNLFLFFTALLQKYRFRVPAGQDPPTTEPTGGFTLTPQPFGTKIEPRF